MKRSLIALVMAVVFAGACFAQTQVVKHHIYPEDTDPRKDIAAGFAKAKREHKRVILDFGGDWCPDCQVLYYYMHQPPAATILEKNYVLVPVFIGQIDKNLDIAAKYGAPLKHGVPALSVVDANGRVIHAQTQGEFSDMRNMKQQDAINFLEQWKQ